MGEDKALNKASLTAGTPTEISPISSSRMNLTDAVDALEATIERLANKVESVVNLDRVSKEPGSPETDRPQTSAHNEFISGIETCVSRARRTLNALIEGIEL